MVAERRHSSTFAILVLACIVCATPLTAQSIPSADSLLQRMRAAASSIRGELPRTLHYLKFAEAANRRSALVIGADTGRVVLSFPVFQIRYRDHWVVVDAGFDRPAWTQFYGTTPVTYWPERWDRVQEAFRGADVIVLTHEHWDHAAGIERGDHVQQFAPRTIVTTAQLSSLIVPPAPFYIKLARDSLPSYRKIDYETTFAVAPGIVLVKAPGHSPGSQWVFVQLASGAEFLLVGDLVWNMAGLEMSSQRPVRTSESMKEDRDALQRQLDLVRLLRNRSNLTVVASHDDAALAALVARGVLQSDFDLQRP